MHNWTPRGKGEAITALLTTSACLSSRGYDHIQFLAVAESATEFVLESLADGRDTGDSNDGVPYMVDPSDPEALNKIADNLEVAIAYLRDNATRQELSEIPKYLFRTIIPVPETDTVDLNMLLFAKVLTQLGMDYREETLSLLERSLRGDLPELESSGQYDIERLRGNSNNEGLARREGKPSRQELAERQRVAGERIKRELDQRREERKKRERDSLRRDQAKRERDIQRRMEKVVPVVALVFGIGMDIILLATLSSIRFDIFISLLSFIFGAILLVAIPCICFVISLIFLASMNAINRLLP